MSKARFEIEQIIQTFKSVLVGQGIRVEKVILFGSHAKGTAGQHSDIDLIVISPDFASMDFKHRCRVLGKAIAKVMQPIEPLAFTPEEFENVSPFNIASIVTRKQNEYVVI